MSDEVFSEVKMSVGADGRLTLKYIAPDGTRNRLDLTAAIEQAAAAAVKRHEKDYHGG